MNTNRRQFLTKALTGGIGVTLPFHIRGGTLHAPSVASVHEKLDAAMKRPVLKAESFQEPVVIESIDLLKYKRNYLCRVHHPEIRLYQANSVRGITAEETIDQLHEQLEKSQAQAVKFKIGGRMGAPEMPKGRTERLIPLVREIFVNDTVICADSSGSYGVAEAIRVGKIMEKYNYEFYEDPVPFDWYEETKQVSDALKMPIAGGEQEPSMRNFRWLLGNDALQVVQADVCYFGGIIRSLRVARMAEVLGKVYTPHVSNIGYVYMLHLVSVVPNAGRYHELKTPLMMIWSLSAKHRHYRPKKGMTEVPTGPGLGIGFDPVFIAKHQVIDI